MVMLLHRSASSLKRFEMKRKLSNRSLLKLLSNCGMYGRLRQQSKCTTESLCLHNMADNFIAIIKKEMMCWWRAHA
mgnify:CR=1 FL=1